MTLCCLIGSSTIHQNCFKKLEQSGTCILSISHAASNFLSYRHLQLPSVRVSPLQVCTDAGHSCWLRVPGQELYHGLLSTHMYRWDLWRACGWDHWWVIHEISSNLWDGCVEKWNIITIPVLQIIVKKKKKKRTQNKDHYTAQPYFLASVKWGALYVVLVYRSDARLNVSLAHATIWF